MDSELVIDDHPNEPVTMAAETWKERKDSIEVLTGRTWQYHGMNDYALRTRSCVLHRFWRDHISEKRPQREYTAVCAGSTCSTESHILLRDGSNGQGRRMEGRRVEGVKICRKYADLHQIRIINKLCDGRGRPPLDLRQLLRIIMESASWETEDFQWEHELVTELNVLWNGNDILEALNYDIDVPCPLQWGLLCFSAPSNPNRKFTNNGT